MEILCSVIICTYNYGDYLPYALNSIKNQNYDLKKLQVIIIDDASTDNTDKVVNKFVKFFPNIKYYKFLNNQGKALAIKKGIMLSDGKFIFNLDADDIYYPNKINNSLKIFLNHKEISMVSSNFNKIDLKNNIVDTIKYPLKKNKIYDGKELFIDWLKGNFYYPICFGSNFSIRKEILEKYFCVINNSFGQTIDTFLQAIGLLNGKIIHIDEVLMGYRQHENSLYISATNEIKQKYAEKSFNTLLLIDKIQEDPSLLNSIRCLLKIKKIQFKLILGKNIFINLVDLTNLIKCLLKANLIRKRVAREFLSIFLKGVFRKI